MQIYLNPDKLKVGLKKYFCFMVHNEIVNSFWLLNQIQRNLLFRRCFMFGLELAVVSKDN